MKKILSFILLIFCSSCFSDVIKTNDINVIAAYLELLDKGTLVIFDVDDVLLMPKDQILRSENRKYLDELNNKLERSVGQEDAKIFYSIIFEQRQNFPVDAKMKDIILRLQSRGIKVLALTNCFTGEFGNIKSMENWRSRELQKNGYNFDQSWPKLKPRKFYGLEKSGNGLSAKSNSLPMFISGIVFTSSVSKGEAFEDFLRYANLFPKKIVFIDDKKKHLESVQNIAVAYNIPFLGIEYTAARDFEKKPLNKQRADLQFEILKKKKKWISDSEADVVRVSSDREFYARFTRGAWSKTMVFRDYDPKIMFKGFPDFFKSQAWLEYEPERNDYESKTHMDFNAFTDYVADKIRNKDLRQLKEIFEFIESCVTHEDPVVGEAATTCFLENLINYASAPTKPDIDPSVFVPLLGPESVEYCKAWDEFTRGKTPGLWEK